MTDEIIRHYTEFYDEASRLTDGFGKRERARTEELITRFLPQRPSVVLDVGGADGIYSFFIANLGHEVHFVDIVPKHIDQARERSRESGIPNLASMSVGDARACPAHDHIKVVEDDLSIECAPCCAAEVPIAPDGSAVGSSPEHRSADTDLEWFRDS